MIDSEKFEQMELDTRPQLVAAIEDLTSSSIRDAQGMIEENRRRIAAMMQTTPATVRNRHEAYGIAAEQGSKGVQVKAPDLPIRVFRNEFPFL